MDLVLLEVRGGVARLTLNNPDRGNALDAPLATALEAATAAVAADPSVRAVLLTGAGRSFCVGGDINVFAAAESDLPATLGALIGTIHGALLRLAAMPVPIVTALNGPVGGGGIGLALCGDMVLASERVKLRGGYSAIGLSPDAGSSWFLTRRAGVARARQIFFLNQPVAAAECLAWGIVDAIHPDAALLAEAERLAETLAQGPTQALGRIKTLTGEALGRDLAAHLDVERGCMLASGASGDGREGVRAFIEKRAPRFGGA